jgi:hypothetical protein
VSDYQEAVRDAETRADPNLTFGYNDLLSEILEDMIAPVDPIHEVTRAMLIDAGQTMNAAADYLEREVRAGRLVERWARDTRTGRRVKAYRRP